MRKIFYLFLAFLTFAFLLSHLSTYIQQPPERVILILISGGDWRIIEHFIKEGKLKNFKRLCEEGSWGTMKTYPISVQGWMSILTGKRKEELIRSSNWDGEYLVDGRIIQSTDMKPKPIWKILNENGKRVGVYNWLVTWPPQPIDGFMITPARLSFNDTRTYPPSLQYVMGHDLYCKVEVTGNADFCRETALLLMEKYNIDLLLVGYDQHNFFHTLLKYFEPEKFGIKNVTQIEMGRRKILEVYQYIDEFIGKVIKMYPYVTIFVVSDHGMRLVPHYTYTLAVKEIFVKLNLPFQIHAIDFDPKDDSTVYSINISSVNLTLNDKIIKDLQNITITSINKSLISNISLRGGKIFFTFTLPDVKYVEGEEPNFYITISLPNGETMKLPFTNVSAHHDPDFAMFAARGPKIRRNYKVNHLIYAYDIAPTILTLMKIKIPKDMDGHVLKEIIK